MIAYQKDVGYALVMFIKNRPEGDMLREIAERALQDFNKRQLNYISVENNEAHAVLKMKGKVARRKVGKSEIQEKCAENLRFLRLRSKLTMTAFGAQFGLKYRTYYQYEHKEIAPTLHFITNVCLKYKISLDLFVHQSLSETRYK